MQQGERPGPYFKGLYNFAFENFFFEKSHSESIKRYTKMSEVTYTL